MGHASAPHNLLRWGCARGLSYSSIATASAPPEHKGWPWNAGRERTGSSCYRRTAVGVRSGVRCLKVPFASLSPVCAALRSGVSRCGRGCPEEAVTADALAIGAALIALALIIVWWWLRQPRPRDLDSWLPEELWTARLVYAERLFESKGPIRISARVDRAYRDRAGQLTLVELKTRNLNTVYPSDVIEMSAQRVALMAATGEPVRRQAYVVVQGADGQRMRAHRIDLLTQARVVALAERRQALLSGAEGARRTCIQGLCDGCAFVSRCRSRH